MEMYNNYQQEPFKCHGELLNKDLWQQFHEMDTEMIITRSGRRMFPALRLNITELNPDAYYCILLELTLLNNNKHKYYSSSGSSGATGAWAAHGTADIQSPRRLYIHTDGPALGRHWMYTAISFGRLKLTNTVNAPKGHVVLTSMHRYQPRVIVVRLGSCTAEMDMRGLQQMGLRGYELLPHHVVEFKETAFLAVTAYQNHGITKLKIDNNPFAKGFRDNGLSKSKRKRHYSTTMTTTTVKEEEIQVDDDIDIEVDVVNSSNIHNPPIIDNILSSSLSVFSENSSSVSSSGYPSPSLDAPYVSYDPQPFPPPTVDALASYYHHQFHQMAPPVYIYYPHHYQYSPLHMQVQKTAEDLSLQQSPKKPRTHTDFSIRAITGLS